MYPPDLLKDLKPLAGEEAVGAFDPQNQLKPLLKAAAVEYQDLEDTGLEDLLRQAGHNRPVSVQGADAGRIVGRSEGYGVERAGVVWIQPPPPEKRQCLKPSFYTVLEGKGAVVVVQADLVANLADSPQAQLNLIQLARLALHPEPPRLPHQTLITMNHHRHYENALRSSLLAFLLAIGSLAPAAHSAPASQQPLTVAIFDFESKDEAVRDLGPKVATILNANSLG